MSNRKIVFIVTEGETDDLFYKKVLDVLKSKIPEGKFCADRIESICVKGFGNFDNKLITKYINSLETFYKDFHIEKRKKSDNVEVDVFLCYDEDVFIGRKKPPINWKDIEKKLYKNNATNVFHIKANKTIEDFILLDFEGVLNYLRLPSSKLNSKSYKGLEGLKKLFKKANKAYIKGNKCEKLLDNLDFNIIEAKLCKQLIELCKVIGVQCQKIK